MCECVSVADVPELSCRLKVFHFPDDVARQQLADVFARCTIGIKLFPEIPPLLPLPRALLLPFHICTIFKSGLASRFIGCSQYLLSAACFASFARKSPGSLPGLEFAHVLITLWNRGVQRVDTALGSGHVFFFRQVKFCFSQISSATLSKDFLHHRSRLPVPFLGSTFILC